MTIIGTVKFAEGDRVVVSERYRGAGCNHGAIGYYGHVIRIDPKEPGDPFGPCINVAFRGRVNNLPTEEWYLSHDERNPFPLYEFELDHAD